MIETQADVYSIADEQRDKRAARPLRPADGGFGFEPGARFRPESGGFPGATPPASGLVRQAHLLRKNFAKRLFLPRTQTTYQVSASAVRLLRPSVFAPRASSNKSPEPTTTSVMPPAFAGVTPAAVVAHL